MSKSDELWSRAKDVIPGGVNSPVRAFRAVGGNPFFVDRAQGPYLFDVDGNRYVDFVQSWGALILGHAHPTVVAAIQDAASRGSSYGAPTQAEVELAESLVRLVPGVEKVRLVNSGTEATMSALRLARAFTGRERVIKFEGGYHGHSDAFLVKAGSGVTTFGLPASRGVPPAAVQDTLVARYNDLDSVSQLFDQYPGEIGAVIVEPVAGNMGVVPPKVEFLQGLRQITKDNGAVLIFDEVITGFRVGLRGAQGLYGVVPDLTTLGKIIGGGLPIGAFGGKGEMMDMLAPDGPVYQAGTLSGNPLATAAGLQTLRILKSESVHEVLARRSREFLAELRSLFAQAGVPVVLQEVGSMFTVFFADRPVQNYDEARACDTDAYGKLFHRLLHRGVFFPPSQFEACFVSAAHSDEVLEETLGRIKEALR